MKKLLLIFAFFVSITNYSQSLDTTFGGTGIITNQISTTPLDDVCYSSTIQPDGKIIYCGRHILNTNITDFGPFIARTNTDGTLDTTFNNKGYRDYISRFGSYFKVIIQSDGKILTLSKYSITRYNSNGSIDTSFGNNGSVSNTSFPIGFNRTSFCLQNDDKIVIIGYDFQSNNLKDYVVYRYNSDGSLDTTFSNDGIAVFDIGTAFDIAYDIAMQSDGKMVITGQTGTSTSNYNITTIRITADGNLDTTFGIAGKVSYASSANYQDYGRSISIQDDGKILVLGITNNTPIILRYTTTGSLDTTFNTVGYSIKNINMTTSSITLGSDTSIPLSLPKIKYLSSGKILVAGTSNNHYLVMQLNADSSYDTSFGTNGIATYAIDLQDSCSNLIISSDNKIIITGTSTNTATNHTKTSKVQFSESGAYENNIDLNLYLGYDSIVKMIEQTDGKIIALCKKSFNDYTNKIPIIRRFNTDGSIDSTFGNNGAIDNLTNDFDNYKIIKLTNNNFYVLVDYLTINKYNANGTLDTTFGTNGMVNFSNTTQIQYIDDIALGLDNKIYVAFDNIITSNTWDYGILRLLDNGNIDTSFGINGIFHSPFDYFQNSSIIQENPRNIGFQSDGKIIISGWFRESVSPYRTITGILRVNIDGTLDTSFGNNGKIILDDNNKNAPYQLIILFDNKFLINNSYYGTDLLYHSRTIKYNSNGSIDTTFGVNGFSNDSNNYYEMILQSDGKILKAGYQNNQFSICRYTSNGSIDTTFGINGYLNTTINNTSTINSLVMLQNGNLLAGGYTISDRYYEMARVRYGDLNLGTLNFESSKNDLIVYPNPIQEEATFEYTLKNDETISIDIVDMQGKIVQNVIQNQKQVAGDHKQKINLPSDLSQGNYFLRFSSQTGQQAIQIIKK